MSKMKTNINYSKMTWDRLSNFCDGWQFIVNANKCELLQMGHNNLENTYNLSSEIVPNKAEIRDLGIIISNDMKMSKHCTIA